MLIFKGEFRDNLNNLWTINIYKEGYSGETRELILGDSPCVIEYVGDDPFKPIKYSGASIKVLTPTILKELYTGKILDVQIEILKNNTLFWRGVNTPNVYNQEYWSQLDETNIEAIDYLSATKYYKWENQAISNLSFLDELKMCLDRVCDWNYKIYSTVDLTKFKNSTKNWENEDGDNSKLNEIMESICQFNRVQMYQFGNDFYLTDGKSENGYCYDNGSATTVTHQYIPLVLKVGENTSNISYGDVYNQISVLGNIIDSDENIMFFDSSDNDKLQIISDNCWHGTIKKKDKDDYREVFTTYATRTDCQLTIPTLNPNVYYPIQAINHYGVFERYGYVEYLQQDIFAEQSKNVTFKNNFVYYPRQTTYVPYTNSGVYSTLQNMNNSLSGGNSVLHYVSKKRLFRKGDYIMISGNLYYTSNYGSGIEVNSSTDSHNGNTYVVVNKKPIFKNRLVTGFVPFGIRTSIKLNNKYCHKTYSGISWTDTLSYADFAGKPMKNGQDANSQFKFAASEQFSNKINSSTEGYAIEIPYTFFGTLEFDLYDVCARPMNEQETDDLIAGGWIGSGCQSQITNDDTGGESGANLGFVHIEDLKIKYIPKEFNEFWELDKSDENQDIRYEAVISQDNVNEFSDVTMNLNTYNPIIYDKLSESYVLDNNNEFVGRVLDGAYYCRPEQHVVRNYVDFYQDPKKIYENTFKYVEEFTPVSYYTASYLSSIYKVGSFSFDVKYNLLNIKGYEV